MRQSPSARDRRCQGAPAAGGWSECSGRVLVTSGWQRCVPAGVVGGGHAPAPPSLRHGAVLRGKRKKKIRGTCFVKSTIGSINRVFRTLAVGRNAEVGRPQRGAQRRAHVAGGHQTFAGRRQVHTPARVRSGAAGRARARPQKMAQHARACVCSPGARGRGAGAGGRGSACPMRGRAVHMAAGAAPLLRRARRAAVRDGHSRRAWASQTRCGPLGRAAPRRSPGRGP